MNPVIFGEFPYPIGYSGLSRIVPKRIVYVLVVAVLLVSSLFIPRSNSQPISFTRVAEAANVETVVSPDFQFSPGPLLGASPAVLPSADMGDRQFSDGLNRLLSEFARGHSGVIKVSTTDLANPNRAASYNENDMIVTASTYKMFTAYAALSLVEQGKLSMGAATTAGTVDYCIQRMVLVSDNICGEALSAMIGWRKITKMVNAAGFTATSLDGSKKGTLVSTSRDEAQLLSKLYDGTLLNKEHTVYLINLMKKQVYRTAIPAGSSGAEVADKVGNIEAFNHDMAIVYGSKTHYVLVVMTDGSSIATIKALAQQVYDFYNQ